MGRILNTTTCALAYVLTSGFALGMPLAQAQAQTAASAASGDDDAIIVTARRREESIQTVPISITSLSEKDLRDNNSFGLEDIAQSTPGLTFQEAAGVGSPVIRGLSQTDLAAFVNNVGVFVDGVFLNSRSSLEFANLDLQRVEVMKGPQSALYGRDTFAGAINYVTRGADLGDFNGTVTGTVGSHGRYALRGSVNLPLGEYVAVRVFAGHTEFDGTIKSLQGGDNLGGFDKRFTVGAAALIQPSDNVRLKLFFARNEVKEDQPPLRIIPFTANTAGSEYRRDVNGVPTTLFSLYKGRVPTFDSVNIDPRGFGNDGYMNLGYADLEFDASFGTINLNYAFSKSQYKTQFANSDDEGAKSRPIIPGSIYSAFFFTNLSGDAARQDSAEIKITSRPDSKIFWMVGASYFNTDTGTVTSSIAGLLANPEQLDVITNVRRSLRQEAWAAYGALTIPLTDKLSIGGELRYTDEDQNLKGRNDIFFIPGFVPTITDLDSNLKYWTGRATIDYKINDDTMLYAYAARGLKTGGINNVAPTSPFIRFLPETNWTYELGIKSSLFDNKLILNAAVYYIDWQNVQVRAPASITTTDVVLNGSGASSKGIEIDANWQVTSNFNLRAGGSFNDPKFNQGFQDGSLNQACAQPLPAAPTVTVSRCSIDVGGNQLPRTSKFQFFGSATYEVPGLIGGLDGFFRADLSHRDSQHATSLNLEDNGAITLTNLRLGVRNKRFEIAGWVDNLFDTQYNARVLSLTATGTPVAGMRILHVYPGNGRTFGVTGVARF